MSALATSDYKTPVLNKYLKRLFGFAVFLCDDAVRIGELEPVAQLMMLRPRLTT